MTCIAIWEPAPRATTCTYACMVVQAHTRVHMGMHAYSPSGLGCAGRPTLPLPYIWACMHTHRQGSAVPVVQPCLCHQRRHDRSAHLHARMHVCMRMYMCMCMCTCACCTCMCICACTRAHVHACIDACAHRDCDGARALSHLERGRDENSQPEAKMRRR